MSDYISKQALLAKLHEMGGCDAEPNTWARGYDDAIDEVYKMVEALPVDTSPCAGSEYIDKAVAVNILNAKADMGVCSGAEKYFAAAAKMIELLPAADVEPARLEEWRRPMSEYIDREILIAHLESEASECCRFDDASVFFAEAYERVIEFISKMPAPTIDAVPVVRCNACKHAETDKIGCYCTLHDDRVAENGFCSYGERKEIVNDR